ncbi:MAG: hypothetical protein HRT92_05580 [Piscirickettsiaceae bacterium]|nr:hypothetical protein [Piscirickettsiaceae bacterium]
MSNKITASINFYFKGKYFTPSTVLDLDDIMTNHHTLPNLYPILAKRHNIDSYSYEYEIMLAEDVVFSDPQGWVTEFMHDNQFDQVAFELRWNEIEALNKLAPIIKQQLDIDDLSQHLSLKNVIIAAYQLGKTIK